MKNIMKKITVTVVTLVTITGFAQAQERPFKAPVAEKDVMTVLMKSTQSDGWNVVKKSESKQFIIGKKYTKRTIMNRKPVKHIQENFLVEVSFSADGYTLQAVNAEGSVQHNLSYKQKGLFSGLKTEIEKNLATSLI